MAFIASHMTSSQETEELSHAFRQMDENGDGMLSREELVSSFKRFGSFVTAAEVN
jgi:Ca2+-binding EF-hand superfamily protein